MKVLDAMTFSKNYMKIVLRTLPVKKSRAIL